MIVVYSFRCVAFLPRALLRSKESRRAEFRRDSSSIGVRFSQAETETTNTGCLAWPTQPAFVCQLCYKPTAATSAVNVRSIFVVACACVAASQLLCQFQLQKLQETRTLPSTAATLIKSFPQKLFHKRKLFQTPSSDREMPEFSCFGNVLVRSFVRSLSRKK